MPQHPAHPASLLMNLAILFLLILLSACAPVMAGSPSITASAGELGTVMSNGILVIATDPAYPPQSELKKSEPRAAKSRCDLTQFTANQFSGFDIDVAVEIARRMGVEPCFVTPTWSQIIAGNWGDRWDINVGSMVITPDRMQKIYFTQPYISGEAVIFVHKNNQTFKQLSDLSGKKIGTCTGCAYESYLRGTLKIPGENIKYAIKQANVIGYDTDTSALADLAVGDGVRLDAVLTDPDTGNLAMYSGMPIKRMGEVVYHDFSAIAVDKKSSNDSVPLLMRITEIIQQMHRDGTLVKLSKQYYGGDFTTPAAKFNLQALEQIPQR